MADQLLYTPEDTAEVLSMGRATIYRWMATGELESIKIGRSRRIPRASIERFIASRTGPSVA